MFIFKIKHITVYTFFFLTVFSFNHTFASGDSLNNVFLKFKPGYGVILRHRESMGNLVGHVPAFQLEMGRQTYGKEQWEQLYKYPEYGFGYYFADLGNPKLLGYVHALYLYLNSPIIRKSKFNFNYHIGVGIAYLTQPWNYKTNYENLAIGSHLNAYFNLDFNAVYRINKQLELFAGFGGTHYSNGAFAQPNLGINVISMDVGVKYFLHVYKQEKLVQEIPMFVKKNEFSVILSGGSKTIPPERGPNYFMSTLTLNFTRQLNIKRKIGFGADIFYDETLYTDFENNDVAISNILRSGIFVSHEFLIKKLSIVTQIGGYIYYKVEPRFPIYTRLGLHYDFTKHIFSSIALKAHLGVADFLEWGVGFRFK